MRNFLANRQSGFTLLEVVFAVGILAIGMLGYTALKISNRYSWVYAKNLTQALHLTGTNLEALRLAAFKKGYLDDPWMSAGNHTQANTNRAGVSPVLTSGDFIATGVSWTVREGCPSQMTKMVTYTTRWNDASNSIDPPTKQLTITQVLVRP